MKKQNGFSFQIKYVLIITQFAFATNVIEKVEKIKYPGFTIDSKLNFRAHIADEQAAWCLYDTSKLNIFTPCIFMLYDDICSSKCLTLINIHIYVKFIY